MLKAAPEHLIEEGDASPVAWEISCFASIDQRVKSPYAPYRCYVIPVIFRLLYTCGLRSSEARLLSVDDVDLSSGKILIRRSKGWEARIIYASEDMLDLLRRYGHIISGYLPNREAFFPIQKGDYYYRSTLDIWLHEFWDMFPEAAVTKGNKPRVHDILSHSYCVYRPNQWVRENADLSALYPYLSEFVGHSNFADKDYYLTLAEPFYPEIPLPCCFQHLVDCCFGSIAAEGNVGLAET